MTNDTLPPGVQRLPLKEVLVVRNWERDSVESLAEKLGMVVLFLYGDQTVESLDEAQMRAAGWIRERVWQEECGQPSPDNPERLCVRPKGHDGRGHHTGGHPGPPYFWHDEVPSDEGLAE